MNSFKIQPFSEWKEGQQGFFAGMPEPCYRAADGASQSMLKLILRSPACWEQSLRYPLEPTRPMEIGTLAHKALLEPDEFAPMKSHHIRPDHYESDERTKAEIKAGAPMKIELKPWNGNSTICKEWIERHSNLPILSREEHDSVMAMKNQFHGDEFGAVFAKLGYKEVACFHRDPATGIMLKGRLDLFLKADAEILIGDLKFMGDAEDSVFSQQCGELNLHVQSAFYIHLVREELARFGIKDVEIRFLHCTVETKAPFFLEWKEIDQEGIHEGTIEFRKGITDWARATETGNFSVIKKVSLPRWKLGR